MKKLFLLDAFALIYRAYFAFSNSPRINSKGLNTSAMFGFTNTLLDVINKEKPSHLAVVFDTSEPTVRHIEYEAYKAHREEMPEDLAKSIPYIMQIIEAFNIPIIFSHGYEADDVIGTLAVKAEAQGYTTYMMTPDKDYGQLVSEHIKVYKPARMGNGVEILGPKEVCEKYGIRHPKELIDILGLWGDKVDNIPGIPGFGEKTAMELIKEYGSIENLITHADQLKGSKQEKVKTYADQALLSKKLATIITDVPIELDEKSLEMEDPDPEKIRAVFGELEFRNLLKKVLGEETVSSSPSPAISPSSGQMDLFGAVVEKTSSTAINSPDSAEENHHNYKTLADTPHTYKVVESESDWQEFLSAIDSADTFCFDSETTSTNELEAELVGLAFSIKKGEGFYIPCPPERNSCLEILDRVKPIFNLTEKTLVGQNIKYDLMVLANYGIELKNKLFDTMLAHYLLQPDMRHGMDVLAETYLGYSPISITSLIGKKGKDQGSMRDVELNVIKEYAVEDADITLQLKDVFLPQMTENSTWKLFEEIEMPLVPVLAAMEREGINLDTDALKDFSKELETEITKIEQEIYDLAGLKFNIASPAQLGRILFEHLKIDEKAKKTATKQYSTAEDVLAKLAHRHPIVDKVLEFRGLVKLKNTYVDTLPTLLNSETKRIHTSYNQAVAATGRLSSNNPNLQNIPIRTERGKEVRKAFVPRNSDYTLLSADYSQIELRIIAALAKETSMIEDFKNGVDIHTSTAAKVYGLALDQVTKEQRSHAKMVNFGIIYGISAFGLAERLNISRNEAKNIIDNYFLKYPGIKQYMDESIEKAREKGYVETILGRRRYLRDINSANQTVRGFAERNAINAPIQGSAADMIKIAMIRVYHEMKTRQLKSKLLLQVHDELVFDAYKPELEELTILVKECMQNALPLDVPIVAETGFGNNWLEAH
ncbi:MAG: DNA polymerase I [Bacteroidia bacterium]|nr:DNA polymerase I [Bacteroidia bacterium]